MDSFEPGSGHVNMGELVCVKNNQFIAFNKPPGIAIQTKSDISFKYLAENYCQHPLHIVHRIDQPASGLVLFAQNKKALITLNEQLRNRQFLRKYLAIVRNIPQPPEGSLVHYLLRKSRINKTYVFDGQKDDAKKAELKYRYVASSDHFHLLEIDLITGRHHQIRAQLAAIGCPIKGDVKYGYRRSNPDRSIHLHARRLSFIHPVNGLKTVIQAPIPDEVLWNVFLEMPDLELGS